MGGLGKLPELGPRLTLCGLRQALPSFQIPVSPHIYTSISWAAAPSTASSLSPVSMSLSQPVSILGPWNKPRALPHIPSARGCLPTLASSAQTSPRSLWYLPPYLALLHWSQPLLEGGRRVLAEEYPDQSSLLPRKITM